jgi:signal peptidase I
MLINEQVFQLLKSTIRKEGWLDLPAYGNSMYPFIQQGDLCRFVLVDPTLLKKGDVILFYSQTGQLIAHRFIRIHQSFFLLKGDTNTSYDLPVEAECILGKLVSIKKGKKQTTPNQLIPRIWASMILTFPPLSGLLQKHLNKKAHLHINL